MDIRHVVDRVVSEWDEKYTFAKHNQLVTMDTDTKSIEVHKQLSAIEKRSGRYFRGCATVPAPPPGLTVKQEDEFNDLVLGYARDRGGWWFVGEETDPNYDATLPAIYFF